ncbi:hypothetical protein K490DRAFT_7521, partial [Saccharata proteae CBS 121410]
MTFQQEAKSWLSPPALDTNPIPELGAKAPPTDRLGIPGDDGRPTIVTFLRHCGCPFAEKTFRSMRDSAASHPDIRFVAVSHSSPDSTDKWLEEVGGAGEGSAKVHVIVDEQRELFAKYGLGVSSYWHVLSPWALWSVYRLGADEGIWNRPTESGNRWQTAGSFGMDGDGKVRWGSAAGSANDVPDFEEAVKAV